VWFEPLGDNNQYIRLLERVALGDVVIPLGDYCVDIGTGSAWRLTVRFVPPDNTCRDNDF